TGSIVQNWKEFMEKTRQSACLLQRRDCTFHSLSKWKDIFGSQNTSDSGSTKTTDEITSSASISSIGSLSSSDLQSEGITDKNRNRNDNNNNNNNNNNKNIQSSPVLLCYVDGGSLSHYPSWHCRNLLLMARMIFNVTCIDILCIRNVPNQLCDSIVLQVTITGGDDIMNYDLIHNSQDIQKIRAVGWERNDKNKLGPRKLDLTQQLDPSSLAQESVDLNLKLMRWRMVPELELEKLFGLKCLLLGAGTLGCNVARNLLVLHCCLSNTRYIVMFLPPFESDGCRQGIAQNFPCCGMCVRILYTFICCNCTECNNNNNNNNTNDNNSNNDNNNNNNNNNRMHVASSEELKSTQEAVNALEKLIQEHDAIFLLTDSREARWLPTLLAITHGKDNNNNYNNQQIKICINAALGFDTFVVMRHGNILPDKLNVLKKVVEKVTVINSQEGIHQSEQKAVERKKKRHSNI
ncbi:hypothetical protein RFI_09883, partial [Reticulomyxa filosa]